MSILNSLQQEWRKYLSRRFWILGALLLALCALALVQYHWIGQVAEAQRQRAKTNLSIAISDLESDFDIEITRAFAVFQFPTSSSTDYPERYQAWIRLAPYPNLVRGVYVVDTGNADTVPRPVIPGEPPIPSAEWQRDLTKPAFPLAATSVSGPVSSAANLQFFSQGGVVASVGLLNPEVMIDGNPAFVFPIMPAFPTLEVARIRGSPPASQRGAIGRAVRLAPAPQWVVVVLDASYIKTTLLPRLVKLRFPESAASDYDILVVDQAAAAPARVIFHSESAPPESKFVRPDGSIRLFKLRLDCFLPFSSANGTRIVGTAPGANVVTNADGLYEILARRPPTCSDPGASAGKSEGLWELLVRYRAGSLDQAMAAFRHRSLFLGFGVLLVLVLGILALIVFTERAHALAEMQTEFVLGISHELRTPLTVIRVAADNLTKGMVEDVEQARKYGEIINTHALELSNMIEETLAFARMHSTALVPKTAPVAPEQIVKPSLAKCERELREADIQVELHLASDLPLVDLDARLMSRCMENLIQNAAKYAAAGRWMAIRTRKINRPEGVRVQISVEDRGPGISSLDLPHIFEPFYRGKQGEASRVPGVGLGLTLVKRIVEAHHGTVEVQSSEITGTLFSLFLPPHEIQRETHKTVHP